MMDLEPVTRRDKRLKEAVVEPDSETSSESAKQMNSVPVTTGGLPQLAIKSPATTGSIPVLVLGHAQPSKAELLRQLQEEEEKLDSAAEAFVREFQQQAIEQEAKENEYQARVAACEKHNARIARIRKVLLLIATPAWVATAGILVYWMGL